MERTQTMQLMDQLEALVMKRGWPVPFSQYYLVNHERLLGLVDELRASLQDEMDARFIQAFAPATEALKRPDELSAEEDHDKTRAEYREKVLK